MRIGISLENFIVDISKYQLSQEKRKGTTKLNNASELDLKKNTNKVLFQLQLKMLFSKPVKKETISFVTGLKEKGYEIDIISQQRSVDNDLLSKIIRTITPFFLRLNGMPFNNIIFSGKDNIIDVCKRNDIDLYFEQNDELYKFKNVIEDSDILLSSLINIAEEAENTYKKLNRKTKPTNLTGIPSVDRVFDQYYTEKEKTYDVPNISMYQYLYSRNVDHLDDIALKYFDTTLTYREFFKKIDECAKALIESGITKGSIATICMPNVPETVILFYAMNKIGAIAHLMDPRTPAEEFKAKINQVHSTMLFFVDSNPTTSTINNFELLKDTSIEKAVAISPKNSMPKILKTLYTLVEEKKSEHVPLTDNITSWNTFIKNGTKFVGDIPEYIGENNPAVIINTGGTTGTSKGAVLSNEYFNSIVSKFRATTKLDRQKEVLSMLPTFHILGLGAAFHIVLANGVKVNLMPKFTPDSMIKTLKKGKTNYIICIPQILNFLSSDKKIRTLDLSMLEYIVSGGDTITPENENNFNNFLKLVKSKIKLTKGYGLTEGGIVIVSKEDANEPGSIGIPTVNTEIKFVNPDTNEEVGYGENGEICISGPIMLEYFENQAETDLVIRTHSDGKKWLHSGDVGYINENGIIFFIDRIKQIIISNGMNIYPSEIEKTILGHSAVKSCVVVGIPHEKKGRVPKAHIILKDGITPTHSILEEIDELCKSKLSPISVPQHYKFRESYPLTLLNKINKKMLEHEDTEFENTITNNDNRFVLRRSK